MLGLHGRPPDVAEIAQFCLDAFDLEPYRTAAGEIKRNKAAWRAVFLISDSEQFREGEGLAGPDFMHLGADDAIKAQRTAAAAQVRVLAVVLFGGEPIEAA